jgi:hypothetical protein
MYRYLHGRVSKASAYGPLTTELLSKSISYLLTSINSAFKPIYKTLMNKLKALSSLTLLEKNEMDPESKTQKSRNYQVS